MIRLEPDVIAFEPPRYNRCGAASHKGIQNNSSLRTPGIDRRFYQFFGVRRKMRLLQISRGDSPYAPHIAPIRVDLLDPDRSAIFLAVDTVFPVHGRITFIPAVCRFGIWLELLSEIILWVLHEEKQFFEIDRKTIPRTDGNHRRLVSDYLVAQYPSCADHLIGKQSRNVT